MEQQKNNSIIIGLTGPTGAGKTTIATIMNAQGCFIVDADKIAKDVLLYDEDCKIKLCKCFGYSISNPTGEIDKKKLAQIAFSNKENTAKLNNITHPKILQNLYREVQLIQTTTNNSIIVIDAPLLFECKLDKLCNIVICASAPDDTRLQRIMTRDAISKKTALMRMNAQHNKDWYETKSNYVINTDIDEYIIKNKVKSLLSSIKETYNV